MKLTQSLVAIAALTTLSSTLSFAGGDINPVTIFEQEPVSVPVEVPYVEPIPEPEYVAPIEETEYVAPVQETEYVAPEPEPEYVAPMPEPEYVAPIVETPVVQAPVVQAPVVQTPVVQAPVVTPPAAVAPLLAAAKPLGLYLSGGLTAVASRTTNKNWANVFKYLPVEQDRQLGFTARLGYDFMDYLGAELRGTYGFSKTHNNLGFTKFKQVGAYLKPNYDITEDLNLYGLLGASKTNTSGLATNTGFSYGAGLDYDITNKISVFTDMVNYMKKKDVPNAWGLTVGAAYQF